MRKTTSLLLGLLSALLTLVMVLVWLGLVLILFFPIAMLTGVPDVTVFVTVLILRVMIIIVLVVMIIPMIIYAIATPHYFLYLDESHSRFILVMHKIVNVILCGLLFIAVAYFFKGILFDGIRIRFEFWFVLTSFLLILPLAVFTKVPKKEKQDAKALS
jgi:hypothetical protein